MRMYNIVQTGPNSQFGGVKRGFLKPAYQFVTDLLVNILPIAAATNTAVILMNSCMTIPSLFYIIITDVQPCFPAITFYGIVVKSK